MTHCPNCNSILLAAKRLPHSETWQQCCDGCEWKSEPYLEPESEPAK